MNNLTEGIETDLKIEQGLNILEFGTEFLLQQAYLRNCPLNSCHDGNTSRKVFEERAQIIAQLNDFLAHPYAPGREHNNKEVRKEVNMHAVKIESASKSDKIDVRMPVKESKLRNKNSGEEIQQNGNESGEKQQKQVKFAQSLIQTEEVKVKSNNKSNKKAIEHQQIQIPLYSSSSDEELFPDQQKQEKLQGKKNDQQEIDQLDLASYYSDTKPPLAMIKEASNEQSIVSKILPQQLQQKNSKDKSKYYNIEEFHSINEGRSGNSSMQVKNTQKNPQSSIGFQYPQQMSIKMSKKSSAPPETQKQGGKSFLNKSISLVKESKSSYSGIFNSRRDETELNILHELSDSLTDEENMKYLLKLENYELEEKFILQKMEKRFQKCAKDIDKIRKIPWSSLKMPKQQLHFRRPNYAHCFDTLK